MSIIKKIENLPPIPMEYYRDSFVSNNRDERIQIQYYFDEKNGHFYGRVHFAGLAQGPPGHVHGGAIASVLDEAMGGVAWLNHIHALTGQLNIKFVKPIKLNTTVYVNTWVHKSASRKALVRGRIVNAEGACHASAEGVFVRRSKEKFMEMGEIPEQLFRIEHK